MRERSPRADRVMWERIEDRLALMELQARGELPRRRAQAEAWAWLGSLDWTRTSTRRDRLRLDPRHHGRVEALLERVWPEWRAELAALDALGQPPTPAGWQAYRDAVRAGRVGVLPDRLNHKTATAVVAPHSKAGLTPERRAALGPVELTRDGSVRMRTPPGTVLRRAGRELAADAVAGVLGEVAVAERAFRDGFELVGGFEALLLVENLGAFQDLTAPPGWLVAHVAGWDTASVTALLRQLPHVPVVQFGDLDPNGVRIVRHLRAIRPDLRWAVPAMWEEWLPDRALAARWPDELDLGDAPPLVQRLAAEGWWLEQEGLVLDPRLTAALAAVLR